MDNSSSYKARLMNLEIKARKLTENYLEEIKKINSDSDFQLKETMLIEGYIKGIILEKDAERKAEMIRLLNII